MASEQSSTRGRQQGSATQKQQRANGSGRLSASAVLRHAAEQLHDLTGLTVESVTALYPTEEGWDVEAEVVEIRRVPDTTSVVATYSVRLDTEGELVGYGRIRRYSRGQLDR